MYELFKKYIITVADGVPGYIYGVLFTALLIASISILFLSNIKERKRFLVRFLLLVYICLVLCSTVLFRTTTEQRGVVITPFWSISAICGGDTYIIPMTIMNMVTFVPIGLLLCEGYKSWSFKRVISCGVLFSVTIEFLQYIFKKGCFELDDILHNTIGCLIGYGIFYLTRRTQMKVLKRQN